MYRISHTVCIVCLLVAGLTWVSDHAVAGRPASGEATSLADIRQQVIEFKRRFLEFNGETHSLEEHFRKQAASMRPTDSAGLQQRDPEYQYARLLLSHELYSAAAERFRGLLEGQLKAENRTAASIGLAESYYGLERYPEAEQVMWLLCDRSALTCLKTGTLLPMARILVKQHKMNQAIALVKATQASIRLTDQQQLDLGLLLYRSGLEGPGFELISGCSLAQARVIAAYKFIEQGNGDKAEQLLKSVDRKSEYGSQALFALGWLNFDRQEYQAAKDSWSQVSDRQHLTDEMMAVYMLESFAQWHLGLNRIAISHFRDAVRIYQNELDAIGVLINSIRQGARIEDQLDRQGEEVLFKGRGFQVAGSVQMANPHRIALAAGGDLDLLLGYLQDIRVINKSMNEYLSSPPVVREGRAGRLDAEAKELLATQNNLEMIVRNQIRKQLAKKLEKRKAVISLYHQQANYFLAQLLDRLAQRLNQDG